MPEGLRDRIKIAAEKNKRSMNAEILDTLESAYPIPVTLEDTAREIENSLLVLKRFQGNTMLMHLADQLDELLWRVAKSQEGTPEDRKAAATHIDENGKFTRFLPPRLDDEDY